LIITLLHFWPALQLGAFLLLSFLEPIKPCSEGARLASETGKCNEQNSQNSVYHVSSWKTWGLTVQFHGYFVLNPSLKGHLEQIHQGDHLKAFNILFFLISLAFLQATHNSAHAEAIPDSPP
jgi:hypothetical protein